jgi:hypothetical protein
LGDDTSEHHGQSEHRVVLVSRCRPSAAAWCGCVLACVGPCLVESDA